MKRQSLIMIVALMFCTTILYSQTNSSNKADAIVGTWMNAEKDAKFRIFKSTTGKYFGKIEWGTGGTTKDINNPNPKLRDTDLVGLIILRDFVFDGKDTWSNGTIYDPKNGKTYSCYLTLNGSNKLDVRGYVGFSLFGRTDTWTKVN